LEIYVVVLGDVVGVLAVGWGLLLRTPNRMFRQIIIITIVAVCFVSTSMNRSKRNDVKTATERRRRW
jgi:hypothetical protein